MLLRVPEYYDRFVCLAGDCPHSCCEKWEVVIDEDHACRYAAAEGPLGEKLRSVLKRDEEGDFCFPLNGGRCPFLNERSLCDIHLQLGEEATSVTCQEHPRFTEDYGPFREVTLCASCPAVNDLLLGSEEPLRFIEQSIEEPAEEGDRWLPFLLPLRARMLDILRDRTLPLDTRLYRFLLLAEEAQLRLDEETEATLPALAESWQTDAAAESHSVLFPAAWGLFTALEPLDADWPALLEQAASAAPADLQETLLERIAVYFAFRYLLKCVNDGDLLGRAKFCVLATAVIARLSAVCGLAEALRRFSCEIEHNDDHLDALQEALFAVPTALFAAPFASQNRPLWVSPS